MECTLSSGRVNSYVYFGVRTIRSIINILSLCVRCGDFTKYTVEYLLPTIRFTCNFSCDLMASCGIGFLSLKIKFTKKSTHECIHDRHTVSSTQLLARAHSMDRNHNRNGSCTGRKVRIWGLGSRDSSCAPPFLINTNTTELQRKGRVEVRF